MNNTIDSEWDNFLEYNLIDNIDITDNYYNTNNIHNNDNNYNNDNNGNNDNNMKCSDLYISTKTKIIYINKNIDIYDIFWKIPIIKYYKQEEGIIKKQIKVSLKNEEESYKIDEIIKNIDCYKTINVLNFINNPKGRIVYKDIRKITVGLSKKDLLFNKNTNKSAFYNCFVLTMRLFDENIFKEFHIKIFNTGKIEIPGIQNDNIVYKILDKLLSLLKEIINIDIIYNKNDIQNVLINSNFNCGFYINREILFNILRNDYLINACYDPCSYPGIQCVYYFDTNKNAIVNESINFKNIKYNTHIVKISYMIFRTGSILIVGKCSETILNYVYNYIKDILLKECKKIKLINNNIVDNSNISDKISKKKNKKKYIYTKY
tara:strand:+ start:1710 stop:2837 length:1128 start_codon:yes stop_codon:yes gene_type:complete